MKEIIRTEVPTLQQIQDMSSNLSEKFQCDSFMQIQAHTIDNGLDTNYWLSISGEFGAFISSWSEVLDKYFELMESKDA